MLFSKISCVVLVNLYKLFPFQHRELTTSFDFPPQKMGEQHISSPVECVLNDAFYNI